MVVFPGFGVVIQGQIVVRVAQLPVLIVPDDDLGIRLAGEVIPEPFDIDPFGGFFLLDPDSAVAGLLAQVALAAGIILDLLPVVPDADAVGNLVDEYSAVDAHTHFADQGFRREIAHPADDEELAGGGFVEGGGLFGEPLTIWIGAW